MKKIQFILSMMLFSILISTFSDAYALKIKFKCPFALSNLGNQIGGYGPQSNFYYLGPITPGDNIPGNISDGQYLYNGTAYNASTGVLSCSYKSSLSYGPFVVSHTLINGKGGVVTSTRADVIVVRFLD